MHKKAQTFSLRIAVYLSLEIMLVGALLFMILGEPFLLNLNPRNTPSLILVKKLQYSPNLINYFDSETDRVYPNIIDFSKVSTERIESNIINIDNTLAARIEVTNLENSETRIAYINEEKAELWEDYVYVGGSEASSIKKAVQIYDEGNLYNGMLKVKVLVKNA